MNNIVAIRGAITAQNTKESIISSSVKLIDRIYFKNGLADDRIVSIVVSVTDDLTAYPAATAIRAHGGHDVPLMSAVEPNIDGAVKGCVRVLVTAQSDKPVMPVYMKGARALRPDLSATYAIALDGPSGAGKSTVAKLVSKKLGITYLDTGALYRALGLVCLNAKVKPTDEKAVERCTANTVVEIVYDGGVQRVIADGVDVSAYIRTPEVSMAASAVSAIPFVRKKLLGLQRDIASKSSVILDGRDIGTVVLPNAEFKFFLTASPEIRARRRFDELIAKGQKVKYEDVFNDVVTRDKNDSTRAVAPLKCAYDAEDIKSDGLTAEQVADKIVGYIAEIL